MELIFFKFLILENKPKIGLIHFLMNLCKKKLKENFLHLSIGWNMIRLIGALVTAIIILYFGNGYLTVTGFIVTAGLIYAYNDYLTRLIEPVGTLFREIGNLQHAIVRTERIF